MHECMETLKNNNPGGKIVGTRKKFRKFQILSQSPEESVMGETDCVVVTENSVVDSKCRSSASELGFEARNSMVVFKSSGHGNSNNSSNQCHVCRFCSKVFRSGKALGGHVRIHGASRYNGQSFSCGNVSGASDYSSTNIWCKKSKVPTYRSNANSNWVRAESIEGQKAEGEEQDYKATRNMIMDSGQEESSDRKMASLYALRRNPKRSRRLTDEDFSMDLIAKNSRACVECGKEFPSSKALSGHMRCHPERHWRGIRPPYDNTNSVDTHAQCNTTGGDIVPAPSSGVSSICWQSSQGSEDLKEKWNPMAAASDDMSRRERMNGGKAAQQPASCSLLSWSVTAKRGRRRPIRSTQPPEEEDGENEEEEAEVHNAKELEDDRDTAHFLVMLACSAANGNDTNKVDRHVQRQMTEESVYHSGTVKETFEVFEAGVGDPGWKKKLKKRTDKSSRPVELGAGKYKCSTCKKLFNTHQALGGHRSSHRKDKDCPAIEEVTEEEITEEGSSMLMIDYHPAAVDDMDSREKETGTCLAYLTEEQSTEPAIQVKKSKVHECCTCHRVFPSGQALGGHKRSHCTADRITERTNNVTSTEKQPKLLKGQVREPLLDLNQPATADGEDFEAAFDMVKVGTPFAKSLNHKIKMTEIVTMNTGFRYVECNICGCLFTSMDGLRAHQIVHA